MCKRYDLQNVFLQTNSEPKVALVPEYAALQAECETLREQVKLLQSAENSYQAGFDAGRATSAKFADNWRKEAERVRDDLNNLRSGIVEAVGLDPANYADSYLISQVSELQQHCEELEAKPAQMLLEALVDQLERSGAENYVESSFSFRIEGSDVLGVVTLQRKGKPTAHELRVKAEAELAELKAKLATLCTP